MFISNKYSKIYHQLMESAQKSQRSKVARDGLQFHHITPRSLGGNDEPSNIVLLTYREHRIAHRLLTKFTTGQSKYKMMWAYKLFDKNAKMPPPSGWTPEAHAKSVRTRKEKGSYKTGKDNIFATDHIKQAVRERMVSNNPMKNAVTKQKYLQNRPHSNHVITPMGYFLSIRAAARFYNITDYEMKKMINSSSDGSFTLISSADRRAKETHS